MNEKYTLQFRLPPPPGTYRRSAITSPEGKDMRAARRASDKPEEWDEPLMAAMTGLVAEDLAEMDLLDYQALQKRFQAMLSMATEPSSCGGQWRCWRGGFAFRPVKLTLSVDDFTCWLDEASAQIKHEYDSQA